jgi:hypothetical protein
VATLIPLIASGGLRGGWGCERSKQLGTAKSRRMGYSSDRNQPGVASVVTTVWRTELGTTLLNGLKGTTDVTAYFAPPVACTRIARTTARERAKFLSGLASRHAGALLLRNSPLTCWKQIVSPSSKERKENAFGHTPSSSLPWSRHAGAPLVSKSLEVCCSDGEWLVGHTSPTFLAEAQLRAKRRY